MKLHVAVVANSHISFQLSVDLCLSELDFVFSAAFSRRRQVSGIVKEHASTPLSQYQVWFMRQDSEWGTLLWFAVVMVVQKGSALGCLVAIRDEKRHGPLKRSHRQEGGITTV